MNPGQLVAQAPLAMYALRGPECVIEAAHLHTSELWGHALPELLGRPLFEALPELGGHEFDELLSGVLATGEPLAAAALPLVLFRAGHKATRVCNWYFTPVRDAPARPTGIIAVALDVTEQLAARDLIEALAQENRRLSRDADLALRARETFLATAAHELRTPITSIRAGTQLLMRKLEQGGAADPAPLLRLMKLMDAQSGRLARLITQLLDISRQETGKLDLECQAIDLVKLVREAVESASMTTGCHTLRIQAPATAPAVVDPLRIQQVLGNLLNNAINYSPQGGEVTVEVRAAGQGAIAIVVTDQGIGIAPEHLSRIFERFYQVAPNRHGSGMGLGLSISREIAELHGGELQVESPPTGGTRFVLTLPIAAPGQAAAR